MGQNVYQSFLKFLLLSIVALGAFSFYGCSKENGEKKDNDKDTSEKDAYQALNTYINRDKYPDFKLGAAIDLNDYSERGWLYNAVKDNFDDVTPGNEMKHSSVVKEGGVMDFSQVENLIMRARDDGKTVYGHTLCWHSQQRNSYLNGLVEQYRDNPEQQKEALINAMEAFIKGMMEACDGYVLAWDVVNEPLSGQDKDGDGLYDLQSASNSSNPDKNFYWQDYLGEDYVRYPISFARQYGPKDMKLFINDYNLESTWDNNSKLKDLIKWIERWESDGVTRIDGIGTQMHVTCSLDPEAQKRQEKAVVQMFELLAASGKLIKISELDMGLRDKAGNDIRAKQLTEEQDKLMGQFYEFIIRKYFEIIPAEQCYGITQWCVFDKLDNAGWRPGLPVGLWDTSNNRKWAYCGFAEGLKSTGE